MIEKAIENYMGHKKVEYSLVIKDLSTNKTIIHVKGDNRVPSASIIKLFIMARAFELSAQGKISLGERIEIKKEDRIPYSIIYLLDEMNTYTIKDLIMLMIIQSDNTATNVLIDYLGMDNINDFNIRQGFNNSFVKRRMLDFETRKLGIDNETSADDVSRLLQLLYEGNLINRQCSQEMLNIMKNQLDFSMMRIDLPDELTIAHKTGDLQNIKNDTGIVFTEKGDYIFSMFTWNAESDNYARNVIGKVSSMFYEYYTKGGI